MGLLARMTLKGPLISVLLFLLSFASLEPVALAQLVNASVSGTVKDETGAVIPGVAVTATNTETGLVKVALSNEEGHYSILSLPPGTYDVQAELPGFATSVRRALEVRVGTVVTLDLTMRVSAIAEVVDVSTEVGRVDTTQSQVSTVITPNTIDNLPTLGRSFGDLAALSPGAYVSGGSIQIGGNQGYQTGYVVDGTNTQNGKNGGQTINFAQDWITEFSLVSQAANAEFGAASGGFVNAVSRSGSNSIHGRVYGYFQDSKMNAYSWGANSKPHTDQQRLGAMVGGPIKKDKAFFFAGWEGFDSSNTIVVNNIPAQFVNSPTLAQQGLAPYIQNGTFVGTSKGPISMLKLDFTPGPRHNFWLRGNTQTSRTTGGFGGAAPQLAGSTGANVTYGLAGAWTWNLTPESLNEIHINYNHDMTNARANCLIPLGNYTGPNAAPDGAGAPNGYWANITYPSANGVSIRCNSSSKRNVGNADLDLTETYSLIKGRHQIKFGGSMKHYSLITPAEHRNRADPSISMTGTVPFTYNLATATTSSLPQTFSLKYQHLEGNTVEAYAWGMFIQDNFQATPDLTFNLGLRYDIDRGGLGLNKLVSEGRTHFKGIYDQLSPRFGVAWSPFENKKTVFRSGFGMFYDKTTYNVYGAYRSDATAIVSYDLAANRPTGNPYCFGNSLCSSGTVPTVLQQYVQFEIAKALVSYALPRFPLPGEPDDVITIGSTTLAIPAPAFTGPNGTVLPAPTGTSRDIVPDFRNGATLQYSLGAATQFGSNITASVDFVYNRGFDQYLIMDTNVNPLTKAPNDPRFTSILTWTNLGLFKSTSLRTKVSYNARRGQIQASYTLGKASDNTVNGFSAGTSGAQTNPLDSMYDWGPSSTDVRHNLNISGTYRAPFDIQISSIVQTLSALPYTASTNAATVTGCEAWFTKCYPVGYTKNSLRGAATTEINARVAKTVRWGEDRSVTALAEAFNLLNKVNFGNRFGSNVTSANFQTPTGAGSMRRIQLGFRVDF